MDKLIYVLWPPPGQDPKQRQQVLLRDVAPGLIDAGCVKLTMYIVDQDARVRPPAPYHSGERMCADVSLWLADPERRAACEGILRHAGFRAAGYLVDESVYTEYGGNQHSGPRAWPDGQRSPGIVTVTLMERPRRLSRQEWLRRWHTEHSPLSAAMQPRARYVRNVVIRPVTGEAPPYEGIVEESWPSARHAANPFLFYGAGKNPLRLAWNMMVMGRSVMEILDVHRIRSTMASEYILKS